MTRAARRHAKRKRVQHNGGEGGRPKTRHRTRRDRAILRLSTSNAIAAPLRDDPKTYGIFPDADRRRRPAARLSQADIDALLASGTLEAHAHNTYCLTPAGRARAMRIASDGDDIFAAQHRMMGERAIPDGQGDVRTHPVNLGESPLARLARRGGPGKGEGFLSRREVMAGEMLRERFERSTLSSRTTTNWDAMVRVDGTTPSDPSDARLRATDAVARALDAVGPGLNTALRGVCCECRGLESVERGAGWPQRSAKIILKIALAQLADHYQLPQS